MRRTAWIVIAVLVVAAGGVLLARYLTTENRERNAVLKLLKAQAAGDPSEMLRLLDGSCRRNPQCVKTVTDDARKLKRAGDPKIIAYDSKTAYAFGDATGLTRVAWTVVDKGLPVVQCVSVHRGGSAIAGRTVTLLRISAPIGNEATC